MMGRHIARFAVVVWGLLMLGLAVTWYTLSAEDLDALAGVQAAALCWLVVGAILTIKVSSNLVGPLALVAGSAWVVYLFGNSYGAASLASNGSGLWGGYFFAWVGAWVGALLPIGVTLLILVSPSGKPVGRWSLLMVLPIAGLISTVVGAALLWGLPLQILADIERVSEEGVYGFVDAGFIIGFVSAVPAAVSIVARYRRASSIERQQVKWLMAATCLFALVFVIAASPDDSNETAGAW
ncbi:MAG TPA: hypothetical protein VMS99_09195 [Acidimicrobiia bacterium]|nr:hypothetical protein [Acidimicrobiia bacterium]